VKVYMHMFPWESASEKKLLQEFFLTRTYNHFLPARRKASAVLAVTPVSVTSRHIRNGRKELIFDIKAFFGLSYTVL